MIPGVSVILLTGMNHIQSHGEEKAPDKVLKKPIDPLELLRVSNSLSIKCSYATSFWSLPSSIFLGSAPRVLSASFPSLK
jgi:hypothetical protein